MDRDTAETSLAEAGEGTTEPSRVRPIANSDGQEVSTAGFEFTGGEYGPNAWITCKLEDLRTLKM